MLVITTRHVQRSATHTHASNMPHELHGEHRAEGQIRPKAHGNYYEGTVFIMASHVHFTSHDLVRIAMFAALLSVFSFIRIPVGPVPITLQTLAVMLAGLILGPVNGMLSVLLMLVLTFVGIPLLGGNGGPAIFVGVSAGYLYGWILGALVIGLIAHQGHRLVWWKSALASLVGGVLIPYAIGFPVQALVMGAPLKGVIISGMIFVPGDIAKVVIATLIATALMRAYPAAFPESLRASK